MATHSSIFESHVQGSLVGYSPRGCIELDTTGRLSTQVEEITSGKFHITQGSPPVLCDNLDGRCKREGTCVYS